jgi:hypothetical protein
MSSGLSRRVFGAATSATGLVTLAFHDYRDWHSLYSLVSVAAVAQVVGGAALQFRRTAKAGAIVAGAGYLVFTVLCVPRIVTAPRVYNSWGNFFEQFSLVTGAAIAYARLSSSRAAAALRRIGRTLFGLCVASFGIEQLVYLSPTAQLVPTWLPPGQVFWALATTLAFALAAIALLANRKARLATRLLTLMLALFGLLVWVPLLLAGPHSHSTWSETAETIAIAGAAWMLAELLSRAGTSRAAP